MKTVSSRSREVAELIRDRVPFKTYGAMYATTENWHGSGHLHGEDQIRWNTDVPKIKYAVYSYATPIAWWTEENGWYRVETKFSLTTTKHQSKLYLACPRSI